MGYSAGILPNPDAKPAPPRRRADRRASPDSGLRGGRRSADPAGPEPLPRRDPLGAVALPTDRAIASRAPEVRPQAPPGASAAAGPELHQQRRRGADRVPWPADRP